MNLPVCRYTAKGFIWYQGESNRRNWYDYKALQVSLVKLWRNAWGDAKMPFYYTQLAPYRYEGDTLRSLPLVIEAQYRALAEIPHSGSPPRPTWATRPASIRRASAKWGSGWRSSPWRTITG